MTSLFPSHTHCVITCIIAAGVAIAMTACRSTEPQQTATAAYDEAITGIEMLRTTATVARARIQTTLDHAGTRVGQARAAGTFLTSNLISLGAELGTEAAFIEESLEQLGQLAAPGPQSPAAHPAARSATSEAPKPIQGARTIVTPALTSTQSGPRLEDITMTSGVNQFDCAIDVNPRFTPASTEIYVVGRAYSIPAGATISSSWRRSGTEMVSLSFHKEHEINDNCIWFFIDQTDTPFTLGSWSVELSVDGVPLASPVAFQIVSN